MKSITVGADPEMFVMSNNKLIPAFEFLPRKEEGKVYWDGFQAEWKYDCGFADLKEFIESTRLRIGELASLAKKHNANAKLSLASTVRVPQDILNNAEREFVELGCMPSYNIYKMEGIKVGNPRDLTHRFSGGHIHVGSWSKKPDYNKIIRRFDEILGIWSLGAAQYLDDPKRRQYYGLAGEYRKPMYGDQFGIEYRTLSNFWLCHPVITEMTLTIAREVVTNPKLQHWKLTPISKETLKNSINNHNMYEQKAIMMNNMDLFIDVFGFDAFYVGLDGVEEVIGNTKDIEKNWGIEALTRRYQNVSISTGRRGRPER